VAVRFDGDRLAWRSPGSSRSGVWVSFALGGRTVMTTRFLDGAGETRSWIVELTEKRDKTSVTRKLTLSPVRLTVEGGEETAADALVLVQTESLAKP